MQTAPKITRSMTPQQVQKALAQIVGDSNILLEGEDYTRDQRENPESPSSGKALCIVRPANTLQLQAILRDVVYNTRFTDSKDYLTLIPQGGNTGLSGSSTPDATGRQIIVSFERMKTVSLAAGGDVIIAGAGVTITEAENIFSAKGLDKTLPVKVGYFDKTTLAGMVATNASGPDAVQAGSMARHVRGLTAVLADGTVVHETNTLLKNNSGVNVGSIFTGSQGTLGLITEVRIATVPRDKSTATIAFSVPNFKEITKAVDYFTSQGHGILSALELISPAILVHGRKHFPEFYRAAFDEIVPTHDVLMVKYASKREGDDMHAKLGVDFRAVKAAIPGITMLSANEAPLWKLRRALNPANRKAGSIVALDLTLPLETMGKFHEQFAEAIHTLDERIIYAPFGHIADGGVHANAVIPNDRVAEIGAEKVATLKQQIKEIGYRLSHELGGNISSEHGPGRENLSYLLGIMDDGVIAASDRLQQAYDPFRQLNPAAKIDRVNQRGPAQEIS